MNKYPDSLIELHKSLQILPGIGEKTAQRLAYFLLNQPEQKVRKLSESIINAYEKCKPCSECFCLADENPCLICKETERNNDILCIVESSRDVFAVENTKEFNGRYFVLGNLLSPIDGLGPKEIRFNELLRFLKLYTFKEIIMAISPSTEGETTMQFLADSIFDKFAEADIKITRLSTGIPYGGDMEYTASTTLLNAFKRRFQI